MAAGALPRVGALEPEKRFLVAAAGTVDAELAETGHNLVFAQSNGDEPLAFRHEVEGIWTVNPLRLFYDLRNDPRRGREQAEALRREVIRL